MNQPATLDIFNAAGHHLAAMMVPSGSGRIILEAGRLKRGIYLVRLHNEKFNHTMKLIVR